ncbi:MAG: hypothetical protein QW587_00505 [Candidatus Bathyarchaeia archaeon]
MRSTAYRYWGGYSKPSPYLRGLGLPKRGETLNTVARSLSASTEA